MGVVVSIIVTQLRTRGVGVVDLVNRTRRGYILRRALGIAAYAVVDRKERVFSQGHMSPSNTASVRSRFKSSLFWRIKTSKTHARW